MSGGTIGLCATAAMAACLLAVSAAGGREWFDRLRRANPKLFPHWSLCYGNGRTSGAV